MDDESLQNDLLHGLFEVTIFMKGLHGIFEVAIGIMFFFLNTETLQDFFQWLAGLRIVQLSDFVVNYLNYQANNFSLSTQHFIAGYFFFYGAVNLFLVLALFRGKVWAYPAAILCFALFIVYQFYRSFSHHSSLLFFFSVFDMFLVGLTWWEYQRVKKRQGLTNTAP